MKKLTLVGIFLIVLILFPVSVHLAYGQEESKVKWVARYNGPGNTDDGASAIAVDPSGNVYVTGSSAGSFPYGDYVTVKYDRNGNEVWDARYNGPGNTDDSAHAIAVDPEGNVYVTGISGIWTSRDCDYATVKYDRDGNEVWAERYTGPGNNFDRAVAIAVDPLGNVYVTGYSYGIETGGDYATVKYDRNGNEVWDARYNGPGNDLDAARALAVDPEGNVYVTGWSEGIGTGSDYATVKYDRDGNEVWVERYNGPPGNYDDYALALAIDPSGNVYVTGSSYGSVTGYDYATVKYDRNGNQLWVAGYIGSGNLDDEASAIAVDPSGNVYVSGDSYRIGISWDYATVKYDRNGNEAWVKRYNRFANFDYYGNALAVDPKGNVYVTGFSAGIGVIDYATLKYDRNGNEVWVARYNGPGDSYDYAAAIAVDLSGNVYVTGVSYGSGTGADYATIKYSK